LIWIISEDVHFENPYLDIYFQGKDYLNDMICFIYDNMKNRYDPEIKILTTKHYMINNSIGKLIIHYRDCSCLLSKQGSNSFLTKELFYRKAMLYKSDKSWKSLNLELMETQNSEKT